MGPPTQHDAERSGPVAPPRPPAKWHDRDRILRTLTFWLRPAFAIRVLGRFQRIAGFDRAIALASSALTAIIPLAIVTGAVLTNLGADDVATRVIRRYDLSGAGAEAVRDVFSPAGGATTTSIGLSSVVLLLLAVLSFGRTTQRLFEQTWELSPLSMRNSINGLRWIGVLTSYLLITGWLHAVLGRGKLELPAVLVCAPISAAFLTWTAWVLSAKRVAWREFVPFGVVGAVAMSFYSVGATVYVPHLFSSYAARYGSIGAVFAMISALFVIMVILVSSAALGREVADELARIRRGERPADDEVRQEWDKVLAEVRAQWRTARQYVRRRGGDPPPG